MDHIKNFHSFPSLYFFLFFSLGIYAAWSYGSLFDLRLILSLYMLLFIFLFFVYNRKPFFYTVLFLFSACGFIRMWLALFPLSPAEWNMFKYNYDAFQATVIQTDYREEKSNVYILKCAKICISDTVLPAAGYVILNQGKYNKAFNYGDVIKIAAKARLPALPTNPGEFNYRRYLQLSNTFFYLRLDRDTKVKKVFSNRGNWAQSYLFNPARHTLRTIIDKNLTGHAPAVVKALILGERGNLDKDIIGDFQKTGVIHVLAISGLHVGFIALMLQFALSLARIPHKISITIVILFLVFFVALVNFKAPVLRASLMIAIYYFSKFASRPQKTLNVVALSGVIILVVQPEQLFLAGFQYSFAAVFGLIYGSEKLNSIIPYFKLGRKISPFLNKNIRAPFIASLSAILSTLPLTWYYFGSFQIGAIVANIFVIPFIALILFLCILFVCFIGLPLFPVKGIATIIDILISSLIDIISGFASIPYIQIISGRPGTFYLLLIILTIFLLFNIKRVKARFGLMLVAVIFTMVSIANILKTENLRVTFIHVGQGDATLIRFPDSKVALVDAGNKGFGFDAGQRYVDPVLKFYGLSKIDYLIGSHPHSDHIGGFEYILNNYFVDTLVMSEFQMHSKLYKRIISLAGKKKVFLKNVDSGDIINVDRQTRVYILHPTEPFEKSPHTSGAIVNNSSLVIKLIHGNNSFLFNGDAEEAAEHALVKYHSFLDCTLLKVGHHGSRTSSTELFLDLARPEYAIISVGRKNKFKHPSPETLDKFSARNIPVYRTDIYGAVLFESDGKTIQRVGWR